MPNPFRNTQVAERYDNFYDTNIGKIYDYFEKRAISQLCQTLPRGKLLDVGCGTGHWSEYFSTLGFEVFGIDASEAMIQRAKQKNLGFCQFQNQSALEFHLEAPFLKVPKKKLRIKSKSIDPHAWKFIGAAFITSLEFMENPKQVINHILQYIHPKGFLIFGMLNALSPLAKKRQQDPIYSQGQFYTKTEMLHLLKPFGEITTIPCAFTTPEMIETHSEEEIIQYEYDNQKLQEKEGNFLAIRVLLNKTSN